MMQKFLYFVMLFVFTMLFKAYISYYQYMYILPDDLFSSNPQIIDKNVLTLIKALFDWVIPLSVSALILHKTKIFERARFSWGVVCFLIGILTLPTYYSLAFLVAKLASQQEARGVTYIVMQYFPLIRGALLGPMFLLIFSGTLKILFDCISPAETKRADVDN